MRVTGHGYRYGFNGMEKDDEISGAGNSMTAEFWQYDSRLGRRWNVDPIRKSHESPYASFANNPIWFTDPNGSDTALYNLSTGFEVKSARKKGAGKTPIYTIENTIDGESVEDMWKRAIPLKYQVGSKTEFMGITGLSFRKYHPLFGKGTKVGKSVYEEDLLDLTMEFNDVLTKGEGYFLNRRMSGPNGIWALKISAYLNFDDGAPYDLKSSKRGNLDVIPSFAAINIGEWSFYNGKLTRYDDYGNISFGYWSRIMGLPELAGLDGAAINQEGKFNTVGDDPRDTQMIKLGYGMFYSNYLPKLSNSPSWRWTQNYFFDFEKIKANVK